MNSDIDYTNFAATLRDVCSNSDKTTGKILTKAAKAAKAGIDHIRVSCTEEQYDYVYRKNAGIINMPPIQPPLIEKLYSLGFILSASHKVGFFVNRNYYLTLRW